MYQVDWANRHPDIWFNIILSVFIRVFLNEVDIWIGRQSKVIVLFLLPSMDGHHPIHWRPEENGRWNKGEFTFFAWWSLSWAISLLLLSYLNSDWNFHHWLSQVPGLWSQTGASSVSQAFGSYGIILSNTINSSVSPVYRYWGDFSAFIIMWASSSFYISVYKIHSSTERSVVEAGLGLFDSVAPEFWRISFLHS